MALRINHNITALDAWRNLTVTTRNIGRTMEKLSSGFRINRAADDPAGLVISEQFRAQIAGLNRAVQNSEASINMIQTAEGALNEINNLLVGMRELAIHAANEGVNDENQLAADQAEITNAIRTIDRIAANTQYGTKKLLDGSAANVAAITTANVSGLTIEESALSDGVHSISATMLTDSSATLNIESLGMSTPTGAYNLSDGVHNLDVIQSSSGAIKTGTAITALDAWGNGLSVTGTAASIREAYVRSATNFTTLANNNQYTITFQLNFQEAGNNSVGMQTLSIRTDAVASGDLATNIVSKMNSAINSNTYLAGKLQATVTAGAPDAIRIRSSSTGANYSLAVGTITSSNATVTSGLTSLQNQNDRGRSNNMLSITAQYASSSTLIDAYTKTVTFAIGSGTFSTLSALAATVSAKLALAANFGTFNDTAVGEANKVYATIVSEGGQSKLKFYTMDEGSKFSLKVNMTGTGTSTALFNGLGLTVDQIANTGLDAIVRFDGFNNSINDVRYFYTATDYTNENKTVYSSDDVNTRGSVTMTVAAAQQNGGINIGNMLLTVKARTFSIRLDGGSETIVTGGKESTVFNSQRDEWMKVRYSLKSDGGTETMFVTDRSLVFQIGANVGQTANIAIDNLSAQYIGRNLENNMFSNLANIDVTTADGAQDSQSVIDAAIDQVTNIRGKLGSFQKNTLESNLTNLRIAAQNLTASESNIRDTDMAKEMSEFVKHQILMQAGVAMLAQGNQLPQVVLSLFG
ncbi:MAG: flagellin [candidate division Zixibacteria bacterium]